MKTSTKTTVAVLRKSPHTTRRNFLKQTGGLTLASAFGLGFVANRQQLLAETSGGGGGSPPPPPPPPPTYCLRYVFSEDTGLCDPVNAPGATDFPPYTVHLRIWMDPEWDVFNCSPTISVEFKAQVWTEGGVANVISGYSADGDARFGQTWKSGGPYFTGCTVTAGAAVAKPATASISVTFSADAGGNLQITGGTTEQMTCEYQYLENLGTNSVRIRQVKSEVKIKRNNLTIEARGMVAHRFDGYHLDSVDKAYSRIQYDIGHGPWGVDEDGHPNTWIPNKSGTPWKRIYQVRGPYVMDANGEC